MFKYPRHLTKKVYSHTLHLLLTHIFLSLSRNFRLTISHSFENIAKTLPVELEVRLSIFS